MARLENISDVVTFVRIVAAGSLSAAARDLDLSLAVVSKRLIRLEEALGARLIHRTTRRLQLTEEGREFHAHCLILLEQVRRAEDAIAIRRDGASGLLRITASNAFARRQIAPRLGRFLDRYPQIRVELIPTDDLIDIVGRGIDIAIRQAALTDSDLITRTLVADRRILCAALGYLDRYGAPHKPSDLLRHRCIVFGDPPITSWVLARGDETETVEVDWTVRVLAGDAAHAAALGGGGIALKSIWEVAEDIRAGRLVELLPGWKSPARPIQIVYPSIRHQTPRIRCFVDFLTSELKEAEHSLLG
jgi:DNA-binding transcriptional LysR family regulator